MFCTGGKFRPDYGLLLELHALTLVARSYALLAGLCWTVAVLSSGADAPLIVDALSLTDVAGYARLTVSSY